MINSARKGLSYAAMLVMLAASVAVAENAPTNASENAGSSWQKGNPKRVQISKRVTLSTRHSKLKLPE
jgi:hypothetical protein